VTEAALVGLFNRLNTLGLAEPGFNSTQDITACPGTDTCNLGIASSYGMALELEKIMKEEYPDLIYNNDIKIKISGCMNACGQHNIANIGFQGMSIKKGAIVMPAMQILLGGGFDKAGKPSFGDKVVKMPSKLAPQGFRTILNDYDENSLEGEYFNDYYQRKLADDKLYFFSILKPFTKVDEVPDDYLIDWGTNEEYVKAIGVGECAGVVLDLVGTLIGEAEEKFANAELTISSGNWHDATYHAYNTFVVGAKAILIGEGISCNTQISILNDFDVQFVESGKTSFGGESFLDVVLQINKQEPSVEFANVYVAKAKAFLSTLKELRTAQIAAAESV